MRQMAACGVKEKVENLLEQLINGLPLGVFAHGTKKPSDVREKVNAAQVASEKVESDPTCQAVVHDLISSIKFGLLDFRLEIQPPPYG